MIQEDLFLPFIQVLALVLFVKNSLSVVNRVTPYLAAFGRQPPMLPPIEGGFLGEIDDSLARPESIIRHQARVREIATISMVEATAKARMERADRCRSRKALQLLEYKRRQGRHLVRAGQEGHERLARTS